MRSIASLAALICIGVVGAQSADSIVDGAPSHFSVASPAGTDATLELAWDNGTRSWNVSWIEARDIWVGNDFDVGTISGYRAISTYKFYTQGLWPNGRWDGVRLGFFNFAGGVPGSMLWPTSGGGYFFKPNAPIYGHIWVECIIDWTCPAFKFVAAQEQFYNYPNNDPFAVDNNPTFLEHSWRYMPGRWQPMTSAVDPYRNVMVRVVVNDETVDVSPTSLGRVKALYY
jgi:hypothetical protein